MKKRFCRDALSLLFLMLLCLKIPAQQKALKVGDPIPPELWTTPFQIVNSPQKVTTLEADRGKLILLDFWATWCGSCLQNFLKLAPLEKEFGEKLKIVPVTKQSRAELEKFFATKNGQKYSHLQSISDDKYLSALFPNKGIPYIVWLKDGKVLNTTDGPQVTFENIQNILKGDNSTLQTVLQLDRSRPLMLAEQYDLERETTLLNYALLSKGKIRAAGSGTGFHNRGSITYGRQFTNRPLLAIYHGIASQIFETRGDRLSKIRIVNFTKDPSLLEISKSDSDQIRDEKSYSFEFIVPISQVDTLYPQMLEALNNYSGYKGEIIRQSQKCLILRKRSHSKKKTIVSSSISNKVETSSAEAIVASLNEMSITEIPILIESGLDIQISREIYKLNDFSSVKNALKSAGFQLDEEQREILMLIIKDGQFTNPIIPTKL